MLALAGIVIVAVVLVALALKLLGSAPQKGGQAADPQGSGKKGAKKAEKGANKAPKGKEKAAAAPKQKAAKAPKPEEPKPVEEDAGAGEDVDAGEVDLEPAQEASPEAEVPAASKSKKAKNKEAKKANNQQQAQKNGKDTSKEDENVKVPDEDAEPSNSRVETNAEADGVWEVATNLTTAAQRKKEKKEMAKEMELSKKKVPVAAGGQRIPGMAPEGSVVQESKPEVKKSGKELKLTEAQVKECEAEGAMKTCTVTVPEKRIGVVIGPKGATLKMIIEKTGVTKIDTNGNSFTIIGEPKASALAEMALKELAAKGYISLQFEDYSNAFVQVQPDMIAELIGKQGATIRKIKEELNVELDFPEVPKGSTKKVKVTLAGSGANVEKAKEVVNDIITYYHHEITHPGVVHDEIMVENWQLAWIIGKKGSEMRHIQSNFKVRVYVPRDGAANKNTVIVGEPLNVERSKQYMERILYSTESAKDSREANSGAKDGDHWGDEEEHEKWMDQYMFKR